MNQPDFTPLRQLPPLLLSWYDERSRKLPWRENPTPYRVWISEIMLQQTRVEAGLGYFERFVRELPDVQALAEVDEQKLLKLWEGLGYYNRARNLQKAARIVVEQYGGTLPADCAELEKLPGIGPYTAGAIGSIAFGLRRPAVDGNVLRVVSRLLCWEQDMQQQTVKKAVARALLEILPNRVGDFNQSMMELGALVCRPGSPLCEECPVKAICVAYETGAQQQLPLKPQKRPRRTEKRTVMLVINDTQVSIRRRPNRGILAGMWEFPNLDGLLTKEQAAGWAREQGVELEAISPAPTHRHLFTHVEWQLSGWVIRASNPLPFTTVNASQLESDYPLPSAFAPYTSLALSLLRSPGVQCSL